MDSQVRKVHQVSEGNLEDQDPRASLDTQEYLDFQELQVLQDCQENLEKKGSMEFWDLQGC